MKIRRDIDEIEKMRQLPQNVEILYLKDEVSKKGKLILYPSQINFCGNVFAHDLIKYAKSGGDMKSLTANSVYKKLKLEG